MFVLKGAVRRARAVDMSPSGETFTGFTVNSNTPVISFTVGPYDGPFVNYDSLNSLADNPGI